MTVNTALLVLALGISTAISWGMSDFFAAKSSRAIGPLVSTGLVFNMVAVVSAVIYAIFMRPSVHLSFGSVLYAAGAGVFTGLAGMLLFIGLSAGPVSIVSPISSTYPLCTTLIAVALFRARLSYVQIAGIILVVTGVIVASGVLTSRASERRVSRGPVLGLLASLCFGVGFALQAHAIATIPWQTVWLITNIVTMPVLIVSIALIPTADDRSLRMFVKGLANPFIYVSVVASVIGFLAYNFGVSRSVISGGATMTALSACYPIITIILALRHLDEKVRFIPLAGAVAGIAGVVVLSLG